MTMIRIIADTQSNAHFLESPMEQAYDQRGGLCQIGDEGVLITANSIDPNFLSYWAGLGFTLPLLLTAGPSDGTRSLSELIMDRPDIRESIRSHVNGNKARLEFFCIEKTERKLSDYLGIPAYCTFDVAIPYSRKPAGRRLFSKLGLTTPPGMICSTLHEMKEYVQVSLARRTELLLKAEDGTGGIACNGMHSLKNKSDLDAILSDPPRLGSEFVVEERIDAIHEVSVHWEINEDGTPALIGIFNQHSPNLGYQGASWPASIPEKVVRKITEEVQTIWWPALLAEFAIGYFCCDIIIDAQGVHYWIDFNPRKGAIRYVYDLTRRFAQIHFEGHCASFTHEHVKLPNGEKHYAFSDIRKQLSELLAPAEDFCIIASNPGVIPFGYVDLTGLCRSEHAEAAMKDRFAESRQRLASLP